MSKQKAFWSIWIFFTLLVIMFFSAVGELKQMNFGKSILLAIIPLAVAYPIFRWVKSSDDFH